ncbi:MAG: AAA family ATPase [Magnetococcales bacterium]|nr:AAA family ATPase [Magnetococcales bacterium]
MYQSFFKLNESPFAITPNPRFLFLSQRHREALAHLYFSLQNSIGFVLLTGEVGTGKTTVSRCLFEQLPSNISLALIFNPRLTAQELIASICDEFEVPYDHENATLKSLFDRLNHFLLTAHAQGKRAILVLDEAQNLSLDLLEQIRMLSNMETATDKLLQIVLIGQPELLDILAQPGLRQFNQRITARFHITPFNGMETKHYIHHRLSVAGCSAPLFSPLAMRLVHYYSKGIPRLINQICDRALLGAYTLNRKRIGIRTIHRAAVEIAGHGYPRRRWRFWTGIAAFLVLGFLWLGRERIQDASLHVPWNMGRGHIQVSSPTTISTIKNPPAPTIFEATPPNAANIAVIPPLDPSASIPDNTLPPAIIPEKENAPPLPAIPPTSSIIKPMTISLPNPKPLRVIPPMESPSEREAFKGKIDIAWSQLATTDASPNPDQHQIHESDTTRMDSILADPGHPTSYGVTLKTLLRLWRSDLSELEGMPTCDQIAAFGLRCHTQKGGWATLRELGVPVLLHLKSGGGKDHYAVVNGMNENRVVLVLGSKREELSFTEVDPSWPGSFTLIFRATPAGQSRLIPGEQGQDIAWLGNQLTTIQSQALMTTTPDFYGPELQERLQRFQKENRLFADGIAGPFTLLKLDLQAHDPKRWIPTMPGILE